MNIAGDTLSAEVNAVFNWVYGEYFSSDARRYRRQRLFSSPSARLNLGF